MAQVTEYDHKPMTDCEISTNLLIDILLLFNIFAEASAINERRLIIDLRNLKILLHPMEIEDETFVALKFNFMSAMKKAKTKELSWHFSRTCHSALD